MPDVFHHQLLKRQSARKVRLRPSEHLRAGMDFTLTTIRKPGSMNMHHIDARMQRCIDDCLACYSTCLSMAMGHCLEMGGAHTEKKHFTLMMACAEICRTSAHFMLIGSPHHAHLCAECAEICTECAQDCERIGAMDECVAACRKCAESCRAMT
jgi:hypothetical protein